MKIAVFGSTGGTGLEIVEQALKAGHYVTAVARKPSAIPFQHQHLKLLRADVLVPETLPRAITGQEVVVSAIGAADRAPTKIYSIGLMNILLAMNSAGVRRLICISASGLDPGPLIQKIIARPLLWWLFKDGYTDMSHMEIIVKASNVDWTILRPPRLTNEVHTGKYHVAVNKQLSHGWKISRADLADYIVKHLHDPAIHRKVVELAY